MKLNIKKIAAYCVISVIVGATAAALIGANSASHERGLYLKAQEQVKAEKLEKLRLEASFETEHFIIRYFPAEAEPDTVSKFAEYAEAAYEPVKEKLKSQYQQKTNIIIKELEDSEVVGYVNAGIIYLPPIIKPTTKGTIIHEFTHIIIDDITSNNCPKWLNEGIAVLMVESLLNVVYILDDDDLQLNRAYTMAELEDFNNIKNKAFAYHQASVIVRYIIDIHGKDKLLKILDDLKYPNPNLPRIIKNRLGIDYKTFEQNVSVYICQYDLKK